MINTGMQDIFCTGRPSALRRRNCDVDRCECTLIGSEHGQIFSSEDILRIHSIMDWLTLMTMFKQ